VEGVPALRFATAARRLGAAARASGLVVPAFRSPPRVAGASRTLKRYPGGAVISVKLRDRAYVDVVDDMIDGVLVTNRVGVESRPRLRRVQVRILFRARSSCSARSVTSCPMSATSGESRDGVSLTNLDQSLFEGADATKRDLVDYLDGVHDRIIPELADRPLSVIRVHRGQEAFMQKNVPKYTPEWVRTVRLWAETSKRDVSYALCNDRRTLLWFANQRAVEYHPSLARADRPDHPTALVLDLDPPDPDAFPMAVRAAQLVREVLADVGLDGAVKTSGAKGVHVFVPIDEGTSGPDAAAATRAIAARAERLDPRLTTTAFVKEAREGKVFVDPTRVGGATVIAAYSPRVRPGTPVSFPVDWNDLDDVRPADFTVHTALQHLGNGDPWVDQLPAPQTLPDDLIEEGRPIPVARVQAMHEGRRRARQRRDSASGT
jgi:bifunctional non-homologous end joining protein LigD